MELIMGEEMGNMPEGGGGGDKKERGGRWGLDVGKEEFEGRDRAEGGGREGWNLYDLMFG